MASSRLGGRTEDSIELVVVTSILLGILLAGGSDVVRKRKTCAISKS